VLPQLRELEHRFGPRVAVIGVHSGKYVAERETPRIREATQRLDVSHPVVNDRQYRIWRSFAVRAWPTLVLIDPKGYVLGSHAGEFTAEMLEPLIERLIVASRADGGIDSTPVPEIPDASAMPAGVLRYPGKVAVSGNRLAIADTGHHRILVGTLDRAGSLEETGRWRFTTTQTFGDGTAGFTDGASPRFSAPNGVVFADDTLIVADTENHSIRAIDLATGTVRTVAGTGQQLRTRRERSSGALSSPWDVAVLAGTVYIAMAGTHQLWALRGMAAHAGADVAAGTGAEDIADGAAGDALLAQPMGVSAAPDGRRLFFVDAESSAVRSFEPDERRAGRAVGEVHTIVGTGLFDFGDKDGVGDSVRLQHPQGVAAHSSGRLLVADSYNDAVKWVDPSTRRADHWVRGLHEPGGLAYDATRQAVFVADTNAHRILVIDERTRDAADLEIG
jgi:DNA-binding beta-propeller fold protein YncE